MQAILTELKRVLEQFRHDECKGTKAKAKHDGWVDGMENAIEITERMIQQTPTIK